MTTCKPIARWLGSLALVLVLPCLAQAQYYNYKWYPGTGVLPSETCLPYVLLNTASPEVPDYNPVRLKLVTSSPGEIMMYTMGGADVNPPLEGPLYIQFQMRYISGNTTDSARRVASVLFQGAGGAAATGNILWIGKDDIFLWSADGVVGQRAFVDTDDDYHTYRIEWEQSGTNTDSIEVYRDGSATPVLKGKAFSRPQWTADARVAWGHQFFGAQGITLWRSIFTSMYGPYDDDGDSYTPDSCDNCNGVGNYTQDDIDHDGIGNACDVNDSLRIELHSPVDMVVTDPALDSIGKTFNYIQAGSTYTDNTDVTGDGSADDIVTIPRPLSGQYVIRVFPEPGALPDDRYTLTIRINGNQLITPDGSQNAPVSSLPAVFLWNGAATTCGDVNADGVFTASDIIYMVNYVFKGGAGPVVPGHADVNCSNTTTSADIIAMVNFVFKGGAPPCSRTADFPSG